MVTPEVSSRSTSCSCPFMMSERVLHGSKLKTTNVTRVQDLSEQSAAAALEVTDFTSGTFQQTVAMNGILKFT